MFLLDDSLYSPNKDDNEEQSEFKQENLSSIILSTG